MDGTWTNAPATPLPDLTLEDLTRAFRELPPIPDWFREAAVQPVCCLACRREITVDQIPGHWEVVQSEFLPEGWAGVLIARCVGFRYWERPHSLFRRPL